MWAKVFSFIFNLMVLLNKRHTHTKFQCDHTECLLMAIISFCICNQSDFHLKTTLKLYLKRHFPLIFNCIFAWQCIIIIQSNLNRKNKQKVIILVVNEQEKKERWKFSIILNEWYDFQSIAKRFAYDFPLLIIIYGIAIRCLYLCMSINVLASHVRLASVSQHNQWSPVNKKKISMPSLRRNAQRVTNNECQAERKTEKHKIALRPSTS